MTTSTKLRKRVLSGMRPTGKLHLGNYVGALDNWVRMQDAYECFFCVVDWHALTTDYADTSGETKFGGGGAGLASGGARSGKIRDLHTVACPGARRVAPAAFHDHAAGMVGAGSDLQGAAGKHQGKRPGHVWVSGVSRPPGSGHFDVQGGRGSGGR